MTYMRWNSLLEGRFEKCFYVPKENEEGEYFVEGQYINRRGIYKDTYKASEPWADYQLRPNACVALAVAPELFDRVSVTRNRCTRLILPGPFFRTSLYSYVVIRSSLYIRMDLLRIA